MVNADMDREWDEDNVGNYINSKGLNDKLVPSVLSVKSLEKKSMRDGTKKWVLSFVETDKLLTLNKTNRLAIDEMGIRPSELVGKKISLKVDKTTFQGKITDGVRIETVS